MAGEPDVQSAVDELASDLQLSVLVEDRQQRPIWWSTKGPVDHARTTTILGRHVEPAAAEVVGSFGLDRATEPVRTPAMPERGMWARWCVPVRHEGRLHGYLWVLDPDGKVTPDQLGPLVDCAELAGTVLARRTRSVEDMRRRRDALVERLLETSDPETARELAVWERLPLDVQVQVEHPRSPGGWALADDLSVHPVTGRARRMAASGAPLPLMHLAEAVRRARATARAIAAGARPEPASWDALGAWRLVVDAPASLAAADVHPGAEILSDQARLELRTTARVVLDLGGDMTTAATELHVHRTTLYYRLDRIQELTGVDLRQGAGRTDLQLALWLTAYREAGGTAGA
ncbi:helix-turn-helix domain-containing protein [Pseudonocardia sp. C8]|uniref:PucR family transcriptional regulator n=1 Tax=Pseudonocardia sp. C8 TaxID=2762759 RepID=UPI0016434D05|nr:helix-turn-helix domain-containing protein [Pseudonocardia sp. C8]MBC3193404.1 helix-turn-helix domain-containing protein [Pseudonocardia sp. C8]